MNDFGTSYLTNKFLRINIRCVCAIIDVIFGTNEYVT